MRRLRTGEFHADAAGILATRQGPRQRRSPRPPESRNWGGQTFSFPAHLAFAVVPSLWEAQPLTWPRESRAPARAERPAEKVSRAWPSRARRSPPGRMALPFSQRVQVSDVPRCRQRSIAAPDRVSRHAAQYPETVGEGLPELRDHRVALLARPARAASAPPPA